MYSKRGLPQLFLIGPVRLVARETVKLIDTWEPRTAFPGPCHAFPGPCHAFPTPCHAFPAPCLGCCAPCHGFSAPCHALSAPCHGCSAPCHAVSAPCHTSSAPCHAFPASSETTGFWCFVFRSAGRQSEVPRHLGVSLSPLPFPHHVCLRQECQPVRPPKPRVVEVSLSGGLVYTVRGSQVSRSFTSLLRCKFNACLLRASSNPRLCGNVGNPQGDGEMHLVLSCLRPIVTSLSHHCHIIVTSQSSFHHHSFCSLSRMLEMMFFVTGCPFAVRFKCVFLSFCLFL